jgi:hypothetical protein
MPSVAGAPSIKYGATYQVESGEIRNIDCPRDHRRVATSLQREKRNAATPIAAVTEAGSAPHIAQAGANVDRCSLLRWHSIGVAVWCGGATSEKPEDLVRQKARARRGQVTRPSRCWFVR